MTPSGTKIAHGAGDLAEYASVDEQRLLPVLATLGRERIVRTVDGAGSNATRYEIFHDVLGEAVLAWRREQELDASAEWPSVATGVCLPSRSARSWRWRP